MTAGLSIEKVARRHRLEAFDCGKEALNTLLSRFAFGNQQANASQTYLACEGEGVVGYYTLVFGQVTFEDAPERLVKDLARHPMPIMLLARLAIANDMQGRGLGAGLLKDAPGRTLQAAEIAGLRVFPVHAKDEETRAFYERFDFIASPADPFHLFVLLKDIKAMLG
jgi:GNAT superfamily N-acetyltransferase